MPKRQPKPEPITPEEVMDSPALQGFDQFLRFRAVEENQAAAAASEPEGEKPRGNQAIGESPPGVKPIGQKAGGVIPVGSSPEAASPIGIGIPIAEFKPGPKVRRAVKAQDGHSMGEQAVYQALWGAASLEGPDTRLIRIGYGGLQSLCGLDKTNCKDNLCSLIQKLAIEVVSPFSVRKNEGNVYRIFSPGAVIKRRKAAGMEWVIRNKGVRFVDPPMGE